MPRQKIPDIEFGQFVIAEILDLFDQGKIFINKDYQRGDIWTLKQKTELIGSIANRYSIGVLVLFMNDNGQYEILDGQQRLLAIKKYLGNDLDLTDTDISKYSDLTKQDKALTDAYCVYYLKLKSHDPESKEEDIIQTFLRLQEGTPLNKAEKISAHRGEFRNSFCRIRDTHPIFTYLGKEKRFRFRQLAAEMLLIELESNFKRKIIVDLDLESLIEGIKKYQKAIQPKRLRHFTTNLDTMYEGLNYLLTGFKPREMIAFYMLVSYLRKFRADNSNLRSELAEFGKEFLRNLNLFSIYDQKPPRGMKKELFLLYRSYKQESKLQTTSDSLSKRLEIMLVEFKRLAPIVIKDPERKHDIEQKRILFFRQNGHCFYCGKQLNFHSSSSGHRKAHSKGGSTDDLSNAVLVHEKCHKKLEKRIRKHAFVF